VPRFRHDLVITDTEKQAAAVRSKWPDCSVLVWAKPAAETVFHPVACAKEYDCVFINHNPAPFKGGGWLAKHLPDGARLLVIGPLDMALKAAEMEGRLSVTFTDTIQRAEIPALACKAGVGLVADDGQIDSGPRVVSELLAMGLPVIVRAGVRIEPTLYGLHGGLCGLVADSDTLPDTLALLRNQTPPCQSRAFYDGHLRLDLCAARVITALAEVKK